MKLHIQRRKERRGKIKGTLFPRFPTSCQRYRLSQTVLSEKPRGTVARYAAPTTETAQRRKNNSSRLITSKTIKEPRKKGSRKRRWTVEGIETARIQTGLLRHYGEFTRVCSVCVCGLVLTGKRETNIASPATRPKPLVFSPKPQTAYSRTFLFFLFRRKLVILCLETKVAKHGVFDVSLSAVLSPVRLVCTVSYAYAVRLRGVLLWLYDASSSLPDDDARVFACSVERCAETGGWAIMSDGDGRVSVLSNGNGVCTHQPCARAPNPRTSACARTFCEAY